MRDISHYVPEEEKNSQAKAKTHNIEAEAHSKLPMLKHYTGDFGFKIVGGNAKLSRLGDVLQAI